MNTPRDPNQESFKSPSSSEPLPAGRLMDDYGFDRSALPQPPVVKWYKAYCILMILVYAVCGVLGMLMLTFQPQLAAALPKAKPSELLTQSFVMLGIGVPFSVIFLIALFLPDNPRTWTFHIVLICVGLMSCCFWPASIPLLIFWMKPETKKYFGCFDAFNPPPSSPKF